MRGMNTDNDDGRTIMEDSENSKGGRGGSISFVLLSSRARCVSCSTRASPRLFNSFTRIYLFEVQVTMEVWNMGSQK